MSCQCPEHLTHVASWYPADVGDFVRHLLFSEHTFQLARVQLSICVDVKFIEQSFQVIHVRLPVLFI